MPNLFEKPIAANPMSEFVALPLQFIDQTIQRRQAKYDKARADQDAMEDTLYGSKFLPGDSERNLAIREGYEKQMDEIVESVGGDYSQVSGRLDGLKRRIKQDLQYGELGAQGKNYAAAMKHRETQEGLYQASKIQKSGLDLALSGISSHRTTPNEKGGFSSYSGYSPSNIVNPVKTISDMVDEINIKYDQEGQGYISPDLVMNNISNTLSTMPDVTRSLREVFESGYSGKPEDKTEAFKKFYASTIKNIIETKQYEKVNTPAQGGTGGKGAITPGFVLPNFQMPNISGEMGIKGGSIPLGRKWVKDLLGLDSTAEFTKSINTKDSQERIRYMEKKFNSTFPTNPYDQQQWLEEHMTKGAVRPMVTRQATNAELGQFMTKDGQLKNPRVGLYGENGEPLSDDEMKDFIGKKEDGSVARVLGIVSSGGQHAPGSIIVSGKNGAVAVQPPSTVDVLTSPDHALWSINKVKGTHTGKTSIKLDYPLYGSEEGEDGKPLQIPEGHYQTVHNINVDKDDPAYNSVTLYQNGVAKYAVTAGDELKIL